MSSNKGCGVKKHSLLKRERARKRERKREREREREKMHFGPQRRSQSLARFTIFRQQIHKSSWPFSPHPPLCIISSFVQVLVVPLLTVTSSKYLLHPMLHPMHFFSFFTRSFLPSSLPSPLPVNWFAHAALCISFPLLLQWMPCNKRIARRDTINSRSECRWIEAQKEAGEMVQMDKKYWYSARKGIHLAQ